MTDATPSAAVGTDTAPAEAKPGLGKAKGPIGALYNWVLRLAASKHSGVALFGVSFAESSFFPIPPDVMLLPMCLARPERAYRYALICTVASVLGGMLGYAIGYFLREWLLTFEMFQNQLKSFEAQFAVWGLWVILIKGLTPVPYKLVTIASGLALFNFPIFIMASIATRGARFFLGAFLFKTFGPQIAPVIEKRINTFALIAVVVLIGGFIAATMLH
ncbi:MAG TPA: YqaA family protein [Hyphomonadaceae bacterium]|jgi:membrane protein YqaA with SNARE-associated domain|nr:YqaA family protein [Hyphomonadaceae bacterium]